MEVVIKGTRSLLGLQFNEEEAFNFPSKKCVSIDDSGTRKSHDKFFLAVDAAGYLRSLL